ncbi:MAG: leucine-rich repeat domain-containing protein [Candidatus Thorarchaeota archaeon]
MARSGIEILWDDEEADINGFMLEACGVDSNDFILNEWLFTRENFEKNYKVLVNMAKNRDRRAPYFVLGYYALLTGAEISERLRQKILEVAAWEHEEGYWQDKAFALGRKVYLKDFCAKISLLRPGLILHAANFKYLGQDFLEDKVVVGLEQFNEFFESGRISKISHVNLDGWGLNSIPKEIYRLKHLQSLSLEFNQITRIPSDISELESLEYLYLSYNHLSSLPSSVGMLSSLKDLDIIHNSISSLPGSLKDLKGLEHIYVRGTKIKTAPNFLANSRFDKLNSTIYL